ncbi:PREDICTED: uncharacterized protein LOC108382340 [Rhagoletis zephyria]|uniref:uncharacterized protein LOC108382340 n=1 Tax=Rhagoletis zephyria TaxID=28612 RepID=UPI0008114F69|nr:PREDICTED: uncharacterized protein LOC108382340 [Rhagoletis zephyria]
MVNPESLEETKAKRANLRRWITNSLQAVRIGSHKRVNYNPPLNFTSVDSVSTQLSSYDEAIKDDSGIEYYQHLVEITQRLEQDQRELADQRLKDLEYQLVQEKLATQKAKTAAANSPAKPASNIRLDFVKIPPFDGTPSKYRRFEELFEALIENNPSYDEAYKFVAFTNLIGHRADEFAPNLSPTLDNLAIVKSRMKKHFEEPGRIREYIRQRFIRLSTVTSPSQTTLLHNLIIAWEEGILALSKSGTSDELIDAQYVRLMTSKLPREVLQVIQFKENWSAKQLIKGLKDSLETERMYNEFSSVSFREPKPRTSVHVSHNEPITRSQPRQSAGPVQSFTELCALCDGHHRSIYCNSYDVTKRREIAEKKRLCDRCLRSDHHRLDCRSRYICPCGAPHSKVLCQLSNPRPHLSNSTSTKYEPIKPNFGVPPPEKPKRTTLAFSAQEQTIPKSFASSDDDSSSNSTFVSINSPSTVINTNSAETAELKYSRPELLHTYYKTVVVRINDQLVRVLIDGGGGRSGILEEWANRLKLPTYSPHSLSIGGLGGDNVQVSTRLVSATLESTTSEHQLGVVLPVIASFGKLRPVTVPTSLWKSLADKGYVMSDSPDYYKVPIGIILGLEYVGKVWLNMEKMITEDLCIRQSIFGWSCFGVTLKPDNSHSTMFLMCSSFESRPIQCTPVEALTPIEKEYLDDFAENKVRLIDNRYFVSLPWISPIQLGTHSDLSLARLRRLVRSLCRSGRFEQYSSAIEELINLFAEPIPRTPDSTNVYYLPHHCVIRLDKSTTQLRLVFDGSAAEPGFKSLNDNLFKGVNSWSSLDLLLRFRLGKHAFVSDIEKAFLQIQMEPNDRDALRFYWIDAQGVPVAYRFKVVPFGTSASPFLLFVVMYKHLKEMINRKKDHPENAVLSDVASIIEKRFYVDDLIVSLHSSTPEQINTIKETTEAIFAKAGMNVRKWRTNLKELDQLWSPDASNIVKLLGHLWTVAVDTFSLTVNISPEVHHSVLTKRLFASLLSRIYDPLGLVSPYIIYLRLILRKLWAHSLEWDEPVPDELRKEALAAVRDVHLVNQLSFARNVLSSGESDEPTTLLVYSDASKDALGVVAYTIVDGETKLYYAKSRLIKDSSSETSPKEVTICEAELEGLVMATEVAHHLSNLAIISLAPNSIEAKSSPPFDKVVICSDSFVNLQRLLKHPNDQKPKISLRVNKMRKLVPQAVYRHVGTKQNPADLISRGCTMTELMKNKQWFRPDLPSTDTLFEKEITTMINSLATIPNSCTCSRVATYGQAVSSWRRIARWIQSAVSDERKSVPAVALGKNLLIRYIQRQHFLEEINSLTQSKPLDRSSVLRNSKCFVDKDGILRLRTRMKSGVNLSLDQVNPVILPSRCHLTELLVNYEHNRQGHPGADRTMAAIRDQYFVFGLRPYVRKLLSRCMICKRTRGKTVNVDLGMVPSFRYDMYATPFTNVGMDLFGPLKIAMKTPGKRYGVIFTCATTRSVHLEFVNNMTAQEVFTALLTFIARRGIPHLLYTDNGRQLLAIKKQFVQFVEQISEHYPGLDIRIKWIQLTASSPWRGGFYERLIRIVKDTLIGLTFRRVIDERELTLVLYQIEARMNSRPLFMWEGTVVTPSHFFAHKPLMQLPPIGNLPTHIAKPKLIKDYVALQRHINSVWFNFHSQYLLQLKTFHQNLFVPNQSDNLRVGDAVILKNNTPSTQWPFGVVEQVEMSPDGTIRTVHVRTHDRGNLVIKARDVRTLIPFECTQEQHEEMDEQKSVDPQIPTLPANSHSNSALTGSQARI